MARETVEQALNRRTEEYRRQALAASYRELAHDVRELWSLNLAPNPPAPGSTKRLALLESLSGHTPPKDTLTARDVLAIARRWS